jgi:hypothetical protein
MASRSIEITKKRQFDFSHLATGGSQVLNLLERIDLSTHTWGTVEVAVHQADSSGGSIRFDICGDGHTLEEPGAFFTTATPLFPSTPLPASGPAFVTYGGPLPGAQALVRVVGTKTSGSPLIANVSIRLLLEDGDFRPSDIPGCVLWLDMLENGSYIVASGGSPTVTSITNLISRVRWTESVNPPLYEAAGLSGKPCMKGDGVASRLLSTEPGVVAAFTGNDRPQTIMVVTQPVTAAGYIVSMGAGNSGVVNNSAPYGGRKATSGVLRFERNSDAGAGVAGDRVAATTLVPQVVTYHTPGTTASIYVNNETTPDPNGVPFSIGQITPDRCALFCYPDANVACFSPDRIGTVLVFNTALSDPYRKMVTAWLMARWNIT